MESNKENYSILYAKFQQNLDFVKCLPQYLLIFIGGS